MPEIDNYEDQVYAAVLGKVIGVYMGRPFEGWRKHEIEDRLGTINRYVNTDLNMPLVVPDDDITGTFTFNRILEDSGELQHTSPELYGENWLNYIVPLKSILWWGGMGYSTEHTAFERLRQGYQAPESGSMHLNGKVVSEQIGAQIFIDAFGMCCPGDPHMAAKLALDASQVSHDGDAVDGAIVVATMVAAAFVEKDTNKLLDIGVSHIPADSLITAVHRDVRKWAEEDQDWHATFERIKEKYGYDKYSGNCHIVPNHAIMVMAWAYAPDSFHKSQEIINTAGWDTDCNAANVGSVMGLVVGLEGINADYDFQSPTSDRVILPTAEGTRSISDCLLEAHHVARVGRQIMRWDPIPAPKDGAWHHFTQPGSVHGYRADNPNLATVSNQDHKGHRCLHINVNSAEPVQVLTPILSIEQVGSYETMGTPRLGPGMKVSLKATLAAGDATIRLVTSHFSDETEAFSDHSYSDPVSASSGIEMELPWTLPAGAPIGDFGIEITGECELLVDSVHVTGMPTLSFPGKLPQLANRSIVGWIADLDNNWGNLHGREGWQFFGKNRERGHLVTGTLDWADYEVEADFLMHCGDLGGLIINYQGLRRYLALVSTGDEVQLLRCHYGESVVASQTISWPNDEVRRLKLSSRAGLITAYLDDEMLFQHEEDTLTRGGIGFICQNGNSAFANCRVTPN